jgi:DNA repair exonuclease SbcCD nuclease subunit
MSRDGFVNGGIWSREASDGVHGIIIARPSGVQKRTMSLRFIHLSDIHFGQERGELVYIHDDVRDQVIDDAQTVRETFPDQRIDGVLVTGDLAYSGTLEEYAAAGKFLDRLTERIGCPRTAVRVIPGNHDIHRTSALLRIDPGVLSKTDPPVW